MQDDSANRGALGSRGTKGDYRLCQDGVQAHRTEPRPAAASDEGGDEGDVVRHRAGNGDDGVRPHGEATRAARPVHRTRMADV